LSHIAPAYRFCILPYDWIRIEDYKVTHHEAWIGFSLAVTPCISKKIASKTEKKKIVKKMSNVHLTNLKVNGTKKEQKWNWTSTENRGRSGSGKTNANANTKGPK
jgi:hypothetical protein